MGGRGTVGYGRKIPRHRLSDYVWTGGGSVSSVVEPRIEQAVIGVVEAEISQAAPGTSEKSKQKDRDCARHLRLARDDANAPGLRQTSTTSRLPCRRA